jgi:hypothetical protein
MGVPLRSGAVGSSATPGSSSATARAAFGMDHQGARRGGNQHLCRCGFWRRATASPSASPSPSASTAPASSGRYEDKGRVFRLSGRCLVRTVFSTPFS